MDFSSRVSEAGLLITYRDNGVGISAEDKKKLFQKGFGKRYHFVTPEQSTVPELRVNLPRQVDRPPMWSASKLG